MLLLDTASVGGTDSGLSTFLSVDAHSVMADGTCRVLRGNYDGTYGGEGGIIGSYKS